MNLAAILSNIGFSDILDILLISFVSYQFYIWFRGTQAFKALIGIVVLSGIYMVARAWGLFLTTWAFQILWQVFVILLIILFQKEIRQMLEKFNPLKSLGFKHHQDTDAWLSDLSAWTFSAAKKRLGALIIFERQDLVFDLITKGTALESAPQPEILWSIFSKESPLHDGAAVISNGKLLKAACFLPLTVREDLPGEWGTRHRASLGLTEQCDAVALSVSEERGEVSVIYGNQFKKIEDKAHLFSVLKELLLDKEDTDISIKDTLKSWVTKRYKIKAAIFTLVFILWLGLAGQQNFEKKIDVPLNLKNMPDHLTMLDTETDSVTLTCRGLRKDVSLLDADNIDAAVDLFSAGPGAQVYTLTAGNVTLPNNRVHLVSITPSRIRLIFEPKSKDIQK